MSQDAPRQVPALKVRQWLSEWDEVDFSEAEHRARPQPYFFQFSLGAQELKRLTGVHKRAAKPGTPRSEDLSTQRLHQPKRSDEIAEFVRGGFPWSKLTDTQKRQAIEAGEEADLRKPGWLPGAVLINILRPEDEREGMTLKPEDAVTVDEADPVAMINLPAGLHADWVPEPGHLHPFEVIDGQHRLWAFEDRPYPGTFELPVLAFVGLDRSWQAYLFWSINITPTRINASLAYDLYPLLRSERWLERFAGPYVYRETRAQELVETLWAHPLSPWQNKINMLGEPGLHYVRQAAWTRSLTATLVRPFEGPRIKIGGLFGASRHSHEMVVPWSRPQQAAFLVKAWQELYEAIEAADPAWAQALRDEEAPDAPAFFARHSLLNTDQGVRAFLGVLNDLTRLRSKVLDLGGWNTDEMRDGESLEDVTLAIDSLTSHALLIDHLQTIASALADFDWRGSQAPGITADARIRKMTFRGGSGYKQLKQELLMHLLDHATLGESATAALEIAK